MIGQPKSLKRVVELFRDPATAEKREILAERWAELDPALRLPGQGLGQKATGCGATIGIQPRCDFACTGCYLGREANDVPAMPRRPSCASSTSCAAGWGRRATSRSPTAR